MAILLLVVMSAGVVSADIFKIDNARPTNSDGVSSNGRIGVGTTTAKGDNKGVLAGPVVKTETGYMMWYSGQDNSSVQRIFLATSPDGLTWTKYNNAVPSASNLICTDGTIPLGGSDRGDIRGAYAPTVIKEGPVYKMWYTGLGGSSSNCIYHATSTNGIDWIKHNNFLVPFSDTTSGAGRLSMGFSQGGGATQTKGDLWGVHSPSVIRDGSLYRMFYVGVWGHTTSATTSRLFSATSPDGLVWTKVNNGIPAASDGSSTSGWIPIGATADRGDHRNLSGAAVVRHGMNYLMWYGGSSTAGSARTFHATSANALDWTKLDNTVPDPSNSNAPNRKIALGEAGTGDSTHARTARVLEDGPDYRFWYTGTPSTGTNFIYAALWTPSVPNVHVTGITGVSGSTATLHGNLTSTGTAATAVSLYWGTVDGGSNLASWATNDLVSANAATGAFSLALADLTPGASYAFRFHATNVNGDCMSALLGSFITAPVEVSSPWRGAFVVSRPATATNFPLAVNYTLGGTATNWLDYYPLTGQDWIPAGATSTVIYVRAQPTGSLAGKTVTLTLAPGGYQEGASISATTTFDPATWHVATAGTDHTAGTAWTAPLRTVGHAMERLISGDTLLVSNGTHNISDMLILTAGVTIRGYPADRSAIIQRSANAASYYRVAYVNHASAVLDGLTLRNGLARFRSDPQGAGIKLMNGTVTNCWITGSKSRIAVTTDAAGCGVYVGGAGLLTDSTISGNDNNVEKEALRGGGVYLHSGTVRNCLIENNYVDDDNASLGGGVYIAGGLLTHSVIRNNYVMSGTGGKRGGGVYSSGGTIRNCLIYGNRSTEAGGGGYVAGGAWENCVVIGNSAVTNGGLFFTGGSATNVIVFNNFATSSSAGTNMAGSWAGRVGYSCAPELTSGTENQSGDPLFVSNGTGSGSGTANSYQPGDFHLQVGSPCMKTGALLDWTETGKDLDGLPRRSGGFVDMGVYQYDVLRPTIETLAVSNVTPVSATLNGFLSDIGSSSPDVLVYWGTVDGGTNAADWSRTNAFGVQGVGVLSTNVVIAVSNLTYYYRYCASNSSGISWANDSSSFVAGVVTVEATAQASEEGPVAGAFTISRPAGATHEALVVNIVISGTASNGVDYSAIAATATIPAGSASVLIPVTPIPDLEDEGPEDVVLTLSPGAYALGDNPFATVTLADASVADNISKLDNTIPAASDGASSNGRIPLGTTTAKGDNKGVAAGSVVKTDTGYMMWYTGYDNSSVQRIFLATSPDGVTWTKYNNAVPSASNLICADGTIALGGGDRGDSKGVMEPTVIKEGPVFKMWYTGYDNSSYHNNYSGQAPYRRIYHATSTNGIDWIKHNNFIVPSSDSQSGAGRIPNGLSNAQGDFYHTFAPRVIRDGDVYRMWYAGETANGNAVTQARTSRVYSATSPDGLVWAKVANSVPGASDTDGTSGRIPVGEAAGRGDVRHVGGPSVVRQGMNYWMWYSGQAGGTWRIYQASSTDSVSWTKRDNTIPDPSDIGRSNGWIPPGNTGRGDAAHTLDPVVLEDGPAYRFWYTGTAATGTNAIYAASWAPSVPNVHITGITGVSGSAATLHGNLTSTGAAATAVSCYWGPADGGADPAAWATNDLISANASTGTFSLALNDLSPGASYAFRFHATNANGDCMSALLGSFITAPVEVSSPWRGAFLISRPATATNFPLAVNYTLSGTATNWVDYYPLTGQDWIPAGATSTVIYVRPHLAGQLAGKTVTLTLAPGGYQMGSPVSATTTFDAETWHVATSGTDHTSGTSWATPLATVGHAVERLIDGDTLLVSNGTHNISDMLLLTAGVTLRGYPADRSAIIQRSANAASYFRVAYVNHASAILDGLTISNGKASYDCDPAGGGVKLLGGTVTNCTISGSISRANGCGLFVGGGLLIDSTVSGNNNASVEYMNGGGIYLNSGTVRNCLIEKNWVDDDGPVRGGGVYIVGGLLTHSTIRSNYVNRTTSGGKQGGGVYSTGGTVRNSLIYGNRSTELAGGGYVAGGVWENCVVIGNSAGVTNGGLFIAGGSVTNTIVYNNFASQQANIGGSWAGRVGYSCAPELTSGTGNESGDPQFVDNGTGTGTGTANSYQPGDFHLQSGSPCIGKGLYQAYWMTGETDFEGRLRTGRTDMGLYQRPPGGAVFFIR